MPSVAQDPPTQILLSDLSLELSSQFANAIKIGGTTKVCAMRNFSTASINPCASNRGMMYVGIPLRRGSACCTGIVKTWKGGIAMRLEFLYRTTEVCSWNSAWETKYEWGMTAAFGTPDVPLVETYAAVVLSGSSTRTQSSSPQASKRSQD
jgi:hypothetical protein